MALVSTFGTVPVAISGTTETVIASTPAFSFVPGGTYAGMAVRGVVALNAGTNATVVTARIRQGTATTGTLVGGANAVLSESSGSAGLAYEFPFEVVDTSASPASQYSLCLLQNAAANGTATTYEIEIDPVIP